MDGAVFACLIVICVSVMCIDDFFPLTICCWMSWVKVTWPLLLKVASIPDTNLCLIKILQFDSGAGFILPVVLTLNYPSPSPLPGVIDVQILLCCLCSIDTLCAFQKLLRGVDEMALTRRFFSFVPFSEEKVWTVLAHSSPAPVTVQGFGMHEPHVTRFNYSASAEQLRAIVSGSEQCQQEVVYSCKKSRLFNTKGRRSVNQCWFTLAVVIF